MKNLVLLAVAIILYHNFHGIILNLYDKSITKPYNRFDKILNAYLTRLPVLFIVLFLRKVVHRGRIALKHVCIKFCILAEHFSVMVVQFSYRILTRGFYIITSFFHGVCIYNA